MKKALPKSASMPRHYGNLVKLSFFPHSTALQCAHWYMPLETQQPAAHRGPILQCLRQHGCMLLLRQCLQLLQSSHTSLCQETKLDRSSIETHIVLVIIIVLMNTFFSNSDTCAYLTKILQIPRLPFGVLVSSPFRHLKWLMWLNHLLL